MLEVMGENYIRTARAFGLPERMIVYRYALKIAILPTVTLLGVGIGNLLSGAVFAEIVFARPGIGKLIYDMAITRNYPGGPGCGAGHDRAVRARARCSPTCSTPGSTRVSAPASESPRAGVADRGASPACAGCSPIRSGSPA